MKGKNLIAFEILSVRMLPPIVTVIPFFILARLLGLFDTHILLVAIYTLSGLPFVVWVMRAFINDVPASIEEAALVDGCSRYQSFVFVTLPLLLPGLAATIVIVFMFAWNEYLFASLLTSTKAKTLPVIASMAIKPKAISWGLACAAGVLMSVPVVILVMFMQRYLVRGADVRRDQGVAGGRDEYRDRRPRKEVRHHDGGQRRVADRRGRRTLRIARTLGVRQDDHVAHDRRSGTSDRGTGSRSGAAR